MIGQRERRRAGRDIERSLLSGRVHGGAGLRGRGLGLRGGVAILVLEVPAVPASPAVARERGAGDHAELARPLAVQSGAPRRLWRGAGPGLGRAVHHTHTHTHATATPTPTPAATDAAVAWRERGLPFDPPQHDQVDAAAIPALVCQVTAGRQRSIDKERKRERGNTDVNLLAVEQ